MILANFWPFWGLFRDLKNSASALAKTGWQKPERFVAKGRDGKTNIYGVIFRPSTFDPSNKYPIVEQIYAGLKAGRGEAEGRG